MNSFLPEGYGAKQILFTGQSHGVIDKEDGNKETKGKTDVWVKRPEL